jgi:haloacetate dehalogenase
VLVLWATGDDMVELYGDLRPIWQAWADDVTVQAIESGHHMAEEAPQVVADALRTFLARRPV